MRCPVSHLYGHVVPFHSLAQSCGALSVTCTLLPLVLNPDLLGTVPAVQASPFANQARDFMIDLLLPLPSAFDPSLQSLQASYAA